MASKSVVSAFEEEGNVREWSPCTHMLSLIPPRVQTGLFSSELFLTCIDAVDEYIALGTNVGLVYWYSRKKGDMQRLKFENNQEPIMCVKIVDTVDFMVSAGNTIGQVSIFQIPKDMPDDVPDSLKPKNARKVERYTISDLHTSPITSLEWSKNGMKLFSGDGNGIVVITEIDFYMHLCKSAEIVNESYEIIQLSYWQNKLLVSSLYRAILCQKKGNKWDVQQVGKKERKSLCGLGAIFQWNVLHKGANIYCARPGLRLWRADTDAEVQQTLIFKDAINNPSSVVELLNPSQTKHLLAGKEFGRLYVFHENYIVTYNETILFILDPRMLTILAIVDDLRRILSVSVNKDEILVLEGNRSVVRLGYAPETDPNNAGNPFNIMTKSLTMSLQSAVNAVRELRNNDLTPFTNKVPDIGEAEECLELPPIQPLPIDISSNVLESIINEFKDISAETEEIRQLKSKELEKKLKLYNSIMQKHYDDELIHSRRRNVKISNENTPKVKPARKPNEQNVSSPCLMTLSTYKGDRSDLIENLDKEIETKEKMLAKMLELDSLSIPQALNKEISPAQITSECPVLPVTIINKTLSTNNHFERFENIENLVPAVETIPTNWKLDEIRLDPHFFPQSPDEIDNEWEFV